MGPLLLLLILRRRRRREAPAVPLRYDRSPDFVLGCIRPGLVFDSIRFDVGGSCVMDSSDLYMGFDDADAGGDEVEADRKSTRLNSSHSGESRMPSSA